MKGDNNKHDLREFINIVRENHGDIYGFEKSVYIGSNKPITVTCLKHNHDFTVAAVTLLRRTVRNGGIKKDPIVGSCPICREEYFLDIKNKVIDNFKSFHNGIYEFENYESRDKSFNGICKLHGRYKVSRIKHKITADKLECPDCKKIRKSNNKKKQRLERHYNCKIHGNVKIGKNRTIKKGCPTCNTEQQNLINAEIFKKRIIKKYGNDYNVIVFDDYVEFICKKHGNVEIVKKEDFRKNGDRKYYCSACRGKTFLSYEEAKKKVNELGIKSTTEYRNWKTRTHQENMPSNPDKTYKNSGWISPQVFFGVHRSKMSIGEIRIFNYLKRKKYDFEYQKRFNDCRNILPLSFDFYLSKYNTLIEFDGEQHQKPGNFFKFEKDNLMKFEQQKRNDEIKNAYCREKNINLIRIHNDDLINNVIEWTLDVEISKMVVESIMKE